LSAAPLRDSGLPSTADVEWVTIFYMADEYKSLKVPHWVYENAQQARADLVRRGIESVPESLAAPKQCPRCRGPVTHVAATVTVHFDHIQCSGCGYRQQTLSLSGVGLGVLLGLGIDALIGAVNEPARKLKAKRPGAAKARSGARKSTARVR
jgi:hypothetical protein